MLQKMNFAGLVAGAVLAGAVGASAAVIDFTSSATALAGGTVDGVGWTATGSPVNPNNNQSFDGTLPIANSFGLTFDNDGWGIRDDEIALTPPQSITLTFDKMVKITGFAFLDLFPQGTSGDGESGIMTVDTGTDTGQSRTLSFDSGNAGSGGYAEYIGGPLFATQITFTVGSTNDNAGVADGALAALQISAVPLPAGGLLLLGALGGLAALRRRKKAA